MRAGSLRDKLTLLARVENDWGEPEGVNVIGTIRAEVKDKSGDNTTSAGASTKKKTISAKVRYRKTLTGQELIQWFDDVYTIAHIERDPKRRFMILTCESEQ